MSKKQEKKWSWINKKSILIALVSGLVAIGAVISLIFFIKPAWVFLNANDTNTFHLTFPMKHQTIGGEFLDITFDRNIADWHQMSYDDIDLWINKEKVSGEVDLKTQKILSVSTLRNGYRVHFNINENGIREGDVVKFSSKRHNKLQAKMHGKWGFYLKPNRSWVYKNLDTPQVDYVIKKPSRVLQPLYEVGFYDSETVDDLENYLSLYMGEEVNGWCVGPQKKLPTNIVLQKNNQAIFEIAEPIKADEKSWCIYLLNKHLVSYQSKEPIDRLIYGGAYVSMGLKEIFNPENNFYSNLNIDFATPMIEDLYMETEEELIDYRIDRKKDLLDHISISPKAEVDFENMYFSPTNAIIPLKLAENTKYVISLKPLKDVYGQRTEAHSFEVEIGEQEYLGIEMEKAKSVYQNTDLPKFNLIQYKNPKAEIKLCRINMEQYGVIEHMYNKRKDIENSDYFFKEGIDLLEMEECFNKSLSVGEDEYKTTFDIEDLIGSPGKTGLYFMTFENDYERQVNDQQTIQYPLFFSIVNAHLSLKVSKNGRVFLWANDLKTGKGIAGLTIKAHNIDYQSIDEHYDGVKRQWVRTYRDPQENKLFQETVVLGKTDANGFMEVEAPELQAYFSSRYQSWNGADLKSLVITGESRGYTTYVSNKWNDGIADWNFGYYPQDGWYYNSESESLGENWFAHLFSERKLYLPGEKVYLKAIVRYLDKTLVIPSSAQSFNLKITDSTGQTVMEEQLKANDFGSVLKTFEINENAALGAYNVKLEVVGKDNNQQIATTSFNVEEFKNPHFKVEVHLDSPSVEADGTLKDAEVKEEETNWGYSYKTFSKKIKINANVHANYYSGGAVKNAKYEYRIYRQYYYGDDYWNYCYWGCYWEPEKDLYTSGGGEVSDVGSIDFDVTIDHESRWDDYQYIAEVSVTDESGEVITGSNSILVKLPSDRSADPSVDLKINTPTQFAKKGDSIEVALSPNKEWNKIYNDRFIFTINQKIYTTTHQKNTEGRLVPQVDFEEKEVERKTVSTDHFELKNNQLVYKFRPQETGEFTVVIMRNEEGYEHEKQEHTIYIYAENEISNTSILDDNKIKILSEKVSYKLGDTARFLIRLPFDNANVLVTTEKTHVIDKKIIKVSNNTYLYEVKVDDAFVPNAYLSFVAFQQGQNDYKVGYAEIVVDQSEKKLDIDSRLDKKEYKPREEVTLHLTTTDKNKRPVQSELAVAVVDESLIALLGNIDMDVLKKFYKKLAFQTDTSLTSVAMLNHLYFSRKGYVGGSGDKGGSSSVFTRSVFKNTAYYNGSVITNQYGKATVTFDLPDNIGDFRVIVLGSTKKGHFGAHENTFSVRQKLLIEDAFPLIFRQGDQMKLGANVFNHTKEKTEAKITLESNGLDIKGSTKTVAIQPESNTFVVWEADTKNKAMDEVEYTITARANNGENDRIQKTTSLASTPLIADYYSYQNKFKDELDFEIGYDKVANKALSYVQFSVSTSILSGIEKIVGSLLQYPHGCLEQTTSTTLPNAVLLKLNHLFNLNIDSKKLNENLAYGIDRILGMQQSDGGFAYWPGDRVTSHHYSPYAIWGLATMKLLGADVPADKLKKAEDYLIDRFKNASGKMSKEQLSEFAAAFSALGKLKSSYFPTAREIMLAHQSEFGVHENIFYALGLVEFDKQRYLNEAKSYLKKISFTNTSGEYSYWNTTTYKAFLAQLLMEVDPDNVEGDKLIKELYALNFDSYYFSTQTKTQAFIAFIKYLENNASKNEASGPITVNYQVNNKEGKFRLYGKDIFKKRKIMMEDIEPDGKNFNFSFSVDGENEASIYVDANVVAYPEDIKEVDPTSNGVSVSRTIVGLEDNTKRDDWENIKEVKIKQNKLKLGETYMVKLKIKFDENQRDVAIEDHLPAGVKVLNERFKTTSSQVENRRNYWWDDFNHVEYKKNMVFATAERVEANREYEFRYFITPIVEGVFTAPPVSVFPMYQPAVEGHTGYETLTIVK